MFYITGHFLSIVFSMKEKYIFYIHNFYILYLVKIAYYI